MGAAEKLLRRVGAELSYTSRHRVYTIKNHRFSIHMGSNSEPPYLLKAVRSKLRRLGVNLRS